MELFEIDRKAEEILASNGIVEMPVDPLTIAENEGFRVLNGEFPGHDDVKGAIKVGEGQRIVVLSKSSDPNEKKMTLAKLIGYYFLYMKDQSEAEYIEQAGKTTPESEQAAQLAEALLMPRKLLMGELVRELDFGKLSAKARISDRLLRSRAKRLSQDISTRLEDLGI